MKYVISVFLILVSTLVSAGDNKKDLSFSLGIIGGHSGNINRYLNEGISMEIGAEYYLFNTGKVYHGLGLVLGSGVFFDPTDGIKPYYFDVTEDATYTYASVGLGYALKYVGEGHWGFKFNLTPSTIASNLEAGNTAMLHRDDFAINYGFTLLYEVNPSDSNSYKTQVMVKIADLWGFDTKMNNISMSGHSFSINAGINFGF